MDIFSVAGACVSCFLIVKEDTLSFGCDYCSTKHTCPPLLPQAFLSPEPSSMTTSRFRSDRFCKDKHIQAACPNSNCPNHAMHAAQGRLFQACNYSPKHRSSTRSKIRSSRSSISPLASSLLQFLGEQVMHIAFRRLTRMVCACNTDGAKRSNAGKALTALGDSAGVSVSTSRAQASSA